MIGSCDICNRQNVPITNFSPEQSAAGCDTAACFVCQGDDADPYGELEEAVSSAMKEPVLSAEDQIERKCDSIIRELDELCRLATNSETADLVVSQRIAVGQILTRAQLVASFLMTRQPGHLKVVSNG